jgi:LmbE family N-acetylglucosaminyl deacetylase
MPLKLTNPTAEIFIPDRQPQAAALERITHLGIGAHQDDLEFMAFHGIAACYDSDDDWFGGITCTNGAGSARSGAYVGFSDAQIVELRREEQRKAAVVGRYAAMLQLDHPSAVARETGPSMLQDDLRSILAVVRPGFVYTHNLADKHDTHVGVALKVINAIRSLDAEERPKSLYGCEVWRDLDWMPDSEKVVHDVGGHERLATELGAIFQSQIAGGKRYDLAAIGRRRANATFFESHKIDQTEGISFAMDLTPLITDDSLSVVDFVAGHIDRFKDEVTDRLKRRIGP